MRQLTKVQTIIYLVGGLLMVIGAGASLLAWRLAPYVFAVGAICFASMQMLQRYDGQSFIIRRLRRQQLLGGVAFLCTACCMIMQVGDFGFARRNEWVVCLTVACILQLYTAFRIPAELKKE